MVSKNNPIRDSRHPEKYFPFVDFVRQPTTADIRHPKTGKIYSKPYFWRVTLKPDGTAPDSGSEGELWYLVDITSNVANWVLLALTISDLSDLRDQVNAEINPSGAGFIDIDGLVVANASNPSGIPLETKKSATANTMDLQLQVATERTGAPGDKNDAGICSFDDTAFVVDANGYVTLIGGSGPAIDTFATDVAGPVTPGGLGVVDVTGTSVFSDGTVANTLTLNVQATANTFLLGAGAGTTATEFGPLTDGQLIIGSTGVAPVAGSITSTNGSVTVTGGAGTIDLAVAAANDAILTVTGDSGGALSPTAGNINILGGPGVTVTGSGSTLTINSVLYTDQAASTTVEADSGSFMTANGTITLTLPASPVQGERCEFVVTKAQTLIIAANTGQVINYGNMASSTAGTLTSSAKGDAMTLVYEDGTNDWFVLNSVGIWTVA